METAFQLFTQYGIRSVSIMDITKACPEKYRDKLTKAGLVERCSRKMVYEIRDIIKGLTLSQKSETEGILTIYRELITYMWKINFTFFYDLKKYHPAIYSHMIEAVDIAIFEEVKSLLRKGQSTGNITKSIDVDLECILHKMMLVRLVEEFRSGTHQFSVDQVFEQLFGMRFKGIQIN
ncbi:MAG: hypothetical protein U5L96_22005 [Owenweeksia sp.]|nr:hypothetical protein [Owenweeksia sp.]